MKYIVQNQCVRNIVDFYQHALKYRHTYSEYLMLKNIDDAINGMFQIEQSLLRRQPTIGRWQREGWHMAKAGKWHYAYSINGDTVVIEDACHEQNMK